LSKPFFFIVCIGLISSISLAQNISVSQNAFSNQELIEDVLFGTNCVDNINFTSATTGNFNNGELSYGYFQSNNSDFPFEEGLVLTTGRLSNVPGPNNTLSDDDAPNWSGDQDLENILGISNTINATILEFNFVPQANSINFRYIFASEEYRENNATTCLFSDAFAFLIRPLGGQYQNLALVPGTNTPVQVTTVRPEIPDECPAVNEEYFGQFNGIVSPINFNGQTAILTAETDVIAGQTYEVKLVIADETNFRFDSAVFIEANSFNIGIDLGQNQTLCKDEDLTLQIENDEALDIRWFYDGQLINDTDDNILVSQDSFGAGIYTVEVDLPSGCTAVDEIEIIYDLISLPDDLSIKTCTDNNGFGVYNLFDISTIIDSSLQILNFYNSEDDANQSSNPINSPDSFANSQINQIVYVEAINPNNCRIVAPLQLEAESLLFNPFAVTVCPSNETSPTTFPPTQFIQADIGEFYQVETTDIDFYPTQADAINQTSIITTGLLEIETALLPVTLYARLNDQASCIGLVPVIFQRLPAPQFADSTSTFLICENGGDSVTLSALTENDNSEVVYDWETGETSEEITVTQPGTYRVDITSIQNINGQEIVCTNFKIFNVIGSSIPEVTYTQSGFAGSNNNTLVITAEGSGDYEYALNDFNYVDNNVFNVTMQENTIRVRDKNGCGVVELNFTALQIPNFFTPNGDGFNDFWQIRGLRSSESSIEAVYIFDRYGKFLAQILPQQAGWDGIYKGKPMPSQDYWYKIKLTSGGSLSGHFTLKR
jgi:gliding motility-associated-like protein